MNGALRGIRVLDLSRVLAGPLCAQMLGDHGAEVIKVEAPSGDETRRWGSLFPDGDHHSSTYYEGLNRNKSNVALDLQTSNGQEALRDLIATADVVIENFKTGTMERWGLGYEQVLAEHFPGLVYCRITGYGVDGPLGGLPGYDAVLQSYGGLMSVNGEPHGEPMRMGVPIVDITAGHQAFGGVLLALLERATSGLGQLVDISLFDSALSLLHPHSASYLRSGDIPVRTGAAHPFVTPYQVFATRGGQLFIAAASDRQFAALVDVLGRPYLADDVRFRSNRSRTQHRPELVDELLDAMRDKDAEELGRLLVARGVPASPVHDVGQALESPHAQHRSMVVHDEDYRGIGVPIKLSRSGSVPPRRPARLGADTASVFGAIGYSDAALLHLRRNADTPQKKGTDEADGSTPGAASPELAIE